MMHPASSTVVSSLINRLGDFLRRCFARSYVVKAEGNSPKTHDFRRCPECGHFVQKLNFKEGAESCEKCGRVLGINGEYKDGKDRIFVLQKPLYSPRVFWRIASYLIIWMVTFVISEYHSFVPEKNELFDQVFVLTLLVFVPIFIQLYFFLHASELKDVMFNMKLLILNLSICAVFFPAVSVLGGNWVFRWTEVPTQIEWETQQEEEAVAKFETLEGAEAVRFAFQKIDELKVPGKWFDRATESYMEALSFDFPATYTEFRASSGSLGNQFFKGPITGDDIQEMVRLYVDYLLKIDVSKIDERISLEDQCNNDPFNLLTAKTLKEHPEISELCQQVL